jgi:hypothetical protein
MNGAGKGPGYAFLREPYLLGTETLSRLNPLHIINRCYAVTQCWFVQTLVVWPDLDTHIYSCPQIALQ